MDEDGNVLIKNPITEAARAMAGQSVDSVTLQMVLQEHYETYYSICNHDARYVPPLSLVTMQLKERVDPYSRYRRVTENYILYGIRELYGFTLSEFLDLPRNRVELLLEIAGERKRHRDQSEDRLARQTAKAARAFEQQS